MISKSFIAIIIFILGFDISYANTWQLTFEKSRQLPAESGIYQHVIAKRYKQFPIDVDMVLFKKNHYKAQLIAQSWHNAKTLADLSEDKGAVVAINGGFYREQFKPNGLLKIDGKKMANFVSNDLLSAIININDKGKLVIYSKKAYPNISLYSAFQAGPLLYDNTKVTIINGHKLRQRSILVSFKSGDIGLFYFSPVSISQAIDILNKIAQHANEVIETATNLDGGVASSFVVNFQHSPIIRLESQPVKMVLLFFDQ
ncbi:phosphodiester glycosidase family protein [Thiotrichales bacterium 19S3-7]|nr:phosphodiester glycosidase family protein [Thiotrichales bacterium 19S3-7]MCF6801086.1 phosphodiester glycosidase family protein [Thiotrichales bacterium 19S3-11]